MTAEIGKRCEFCMMVMGQPYCEALNRQLPTTQGNEPFRPADCKVKELTDGTCMVTKEEDEASQNAEQTTSQAVS